MVDPHLWLSLLILYCKVVHYSKFGGSCHSQLFRCRCGMQHHDTNKEPDLLSLRHIRLSLSLLPLLRPSRPRWNSGVVVPMRGRLLACLPAIRWVPHDIPSEGQQRRARSKAFSKKQLKPRAESLKSPVHRRRSTLSITSTHDPELDARTSPQDQSLFFSKLPLELRRMIYELVVGEEVIHLTLARKGKFEHFLCEGNLGFALGCGCSCRVLAGRNVDKRLGTWILGYLMICRRV